MKQALVLILLVLSSSAALRAQTKYSATDAINYPNKYITVCDTIYKTELLNDRTIVFYLGSLNPRRSVQVIQTLHKKVKLNTALNGLCVCVNGIVRQKRKHYLLYTSEKLLVLGPIDL